MTKTRAKQLQLKALKELHQRYQYLYERELEKVTRLEQQLKETQIKLDKMNKERFIDSRNKVLDSLANITESLSKAIVYTVGKEQL